MKSTEMLKQIKTLLNIEVKLEDSKLENGTLIEAESFEKGKEVFIKTDDQKVAMPVGEYILEDGRLLVVEEEEEKEMAEEDDIMKDMMGRIQNLEDAIADLKADKEGKMEKDGEEEMAIEKPLKSRTVKEEFSAPATTPIRHNPEQKSAPSNKGFNISANRVPTVLDRVLSRLNNN